MSGTDRVMIGCSIEDPSPVCLGLVYAQYAHWGTTVNGLFIVDNVGAVTLRDLSRGLEADGKAGDVPDAAARVAAIRAEFDAVHGALLDARTNR
jgi:hypothetical protein